MSRPHPLHEKLSPSFGIYRLELLTDKIITVYFEEIKSLPISPHLVGSHEMGRCSHVGDGVWSGNFKMVRASLHFSSSHGIPLDLSRPNPLHKISPQDMPMLTLYGFHGGNEYSESWKLRCYMTTMRLTYMVEAHRQTGLSIIEPGCSFD